MATAKTLPPATIFDCLHLLEMLINLHPESVIKYSESFQGTEFRLDEVDGYCLPKDVDEWWENETMLSAKEQERQRS